jgi:hypothetical protein
MPIRPDIRKQHYGAHWRNVVRRRILERAGGTFDEDGRYRYDARCEECGVPDRRAVYRRAGWWFDVWGRTRLGVWADPGGVHHKRVGWPTTGPDIRRPYIILTIAHLNHTPGDDREENLKALCQWCHLNYDKLHHAETRAFRKDAQRPLLVALENRCQSARRERRAT